MKNLTPTWLTDDFIDFEYKKYVLLAYLQEVHKHFDQRRLYPCLTDLINHYNNLVTIKKNKALVSSHFPKQISAVDLQHFTIQYQPMVVDDESMEEIEAIIDFAIPRMHHSVKTGQHIYDEVEEQLRIFPVGIVSLHPETGYLIIVLPDQHEARVYSYCITMFESANEQYRGLKTDFIGSFTQSISNTLESIKMEVINRFHQSAHHAAFAVEPLSTFPFEETLFPVARRSLVRYICTNLKDLQKFSA